MPRVSNSKLFMAGLCALMLMYSPWAISAEDGFSAAEKTQIEQIVRDYLLKNPELLVEMSNALERQQEADKLAKAKGDALAHKAALFESPNDFVVNPDGTIPVVEFFDYNCGYCKRVLPTITQLQESEKDVRFIYKELPILSKTSVVAAKAAIAARMQGKYLAYHNALMEVRGAIDEETVVQTAREVGLDIDRLQEDMKRDDVAQEIEANRALARTLNIRGTPTLFVGDRLIPGAIGYEDLVQVVADQRSSCSVC